MRCRDDGPLTEISSAPVALDTQLNDSEVMPTGSNTSVADEVVSDTEGATVGVTPVRVGKRRGRITSDRHAEARSPRLLQPGVLLIQFATDICAPEFDSSLASCATSRERVKNDVAGS